MSSLITILGPTACGKTSLATHLASEINGEIISADSRQVYRGLDIGSGKDLDEYELNGVSIPYHLIDICDPGYEYNVFEFQQDFLKVFDDIQQRKRQVVLCGGTGMYLTAALQKEQMVQVPEDLMFREEAELLSDQDLVNKLTSLSEVHNTTDTIDRSRIIRAIEIASYKKSLVEMPLMPEIDHHIFGIKMERSVVKQRITERLKSRLENGMIEEVENLLAQGVTPDQLKFYGLEYKFVTSYLLKELNYNDMFQKLNTGIHVFAKKQMTWFRRMEKQGFVIQWIDGGLSLEDKVSFVKSHLG